MHPDAPSDQQADGLDVSAASDDIADLEARTRALLASDRLTEPTRRALQARMAPPHGSPRAFTAEQFRTLQAVCLRLIPEPALVSRVGLAARLDARLADATPRGWRHAEAPDDLTLFREGLATLEQLVQARGGEHFDMLYPDSQDALLQDACEGRPAGAGVPLDLWFEELLSQLVELYYAHPLVQVAIGYDGMADAYGVVAISPRAIAEART